MAAIETAPKETKWINDLDEARKALPKESYLAMKAAGKPDSEIIKLTMIISHIFYALKKEYGLTGMSVKKNTPQLVNEDMPQDDKNACSSGQKENALPGQNESLKNENTEPEDELLPFIVPRKDLSGVSTLRFDKQGVALNAHASRAFGDNRNVQITTTKSRKIVIVQASKVPGCACYELGKASGGSSIKVGGGVLVKALLERGVKFGKYKLEWNEAWKRWETGEVV